MAEKHEVYFATNRNLTRKKSPDRFGDRFHEDGPQFYRVGLGSVKKKSDKPDKGFKLTDLTLQEESTSGPPVKLGSREVFKKLRDQMRKDRRDILVYIHGFANSFGSSLERAAQIADQYRITRPDGVEYRPYMFAFSWPSNGKVVPPWQYFSDRDDAEASGKAMARSLLRLVEFLDETNSGGEQCAQRLHLVAHSMGNWALRHALQGLRSLAGPEAMRPIFENVFLMAADEDDNALEVGQEAKLALLPRLARRIHVYHSADDRALVVSDKTKFNPDRLGFNGPRTFSDLSTRITAVDCELVDKTELPHVNHQYYRLRKEVIQDVRAILSGLARPEDFAWREVVEPGRRYRIRLTQPETVPND
jgi:esterase/lipase superfamily enzyme